VDAVFLQPLQLCMRAPVLPVWDGTLKHVLGKRSQRRVTWFFNLAPGYMEDAQPTEPQHYQRTMYRVDQPVEDAKRRMLETFGKEQSGDVIRTDTGIWYLRTDSGHLLEMVFDVRSCPCVLPRLDDDACCLGSIYSKLYHFVWETSAQFVQSSQAGVLMV
jgi:hypothetical protein